MTQIQQLGTFGQYLTVNSVANTVTLTNTLVVGNSTVNVVVNSSSVYISGSPVGGATNVAAQYVWTNTQSFSNTITFNGPVLANTVNAVSYTIGTTFTANSSQLTIATPVSSNGGVGTSGQVLTSNGATGAPYWSTVSGGGSVNVAAQYAFTNTISFSNVVTHTANVSVNGAIIANGGAGTSGQVLTSSAGGNVYWSTVSGGGGFTNGQSISVSNLAITGVLSANGGSGTSGQYLVSAGTGNTYWSTVSPLYNYSYSSYFNGSSQYLSVPTNAAFAFGTGDFTIECWVYPIALAGGATNQPLIDFRNANQGVYPTLYISGSTVNYYTSGSNRITAGSTLSNNTWYHLAVVRISGSTKLYINGVQSGSTYTDSNSYVQGPVSIANFNDGGGGYYINALISNARIVKGTGVYTGAFTPSTSPLTATQQSGTNIAAITGTSTSLLTCQTLNIVDASAQNFAITNVGGVTTNPQYIPFASTNVTVAATALTSVRQQFTGDGTTTSFSVAGGYTPSSISVFLNGVMLRNGTEVTVTNGATVVLASAPPSGALIDVIGTVPTTYSSITPVSYSVGFNGSTQYLTLAGNTALSFGTGDFTIEFWFKTASVQQYTSFISNENGTVGYTILLNIATASDGKIGFYDSNIGNFLLTTSTGGFNDNNWHHCALVRIGTAFNLYIDGVSRASATSSTSISGGTNSFYIANSYYANRLLNGYLSNFRMVKGLGVYTNNFTVPSSPLAITQSASGAFIQAITGTQTSLLTCNAPTIIDGSTNAFTITNNGSAPVSTAIVPTFTNVTINNTSGSGGLSLAAVQTANLTATAGYIYPINTSSGPIYVTLPASPTAGQQIAITDYAGTFTGNNCIINPNGSKISGSTANTVLNVSREGASIVYVDSTQGWLGYGNFVSSPVGPYNISYLIVAGGGGGGSGAYGVNNGGGGGAGGLISGTALLNQGATYTVTVGGGGNAQTAGSNSSISTLSLTAIGGGYGGFASAASSGGSGGGGGGAAASAAGAGTSGQGNNGGAATSSSPSNGGGGGGGSSASGGAASSSAAGAGGAGTSSSITGSSVTYAGGGGGGSSATGTGGAGGAGGGGAGGGNAVGGSGTTNTGGGGGGGGANNNAGGAGGSGVVILSIPTGNYTGIKTGSPTVTTSGNFTILTFTASGSYTA